MREDGVIELSQVAVLILAAVMLYVASNRTREYRDFFKVLYLAPVLAIIRENDHFLETYVFDEAWEVLAVVCVIYMGYILYRTHKRVLQQFVRFTATGPFICFANGAFIVMIFARIIGQQSLWESLLQEHHHRMIGRFVEETIEFLGYCFILIGSMECYITAGQFACKTADSLSLTQTIQPSEEGCVSSHV
ncbi:MAG: hypothetical protein A2Y07_01110 [Planctomycetes bacterium GWF2_50_10]|nr:MAG: hypothetical protein A2Y07_01110 [Planctomycetes bacterium GWF2_50_10]